MPPVSDAASSFKGKWYYERKTDSVHLWQCLLRTLPQQCHYHQTTFGKVLAGEAINEQCATLQQRDRQQMIQDIPARIIAIGDIHGELDRLFKAKH